MIDKENITIDWMNKISKENRNADKILVEKVIRALLLLCFPYQSFSINWHEISPAAVNLKPNLNTY